MDVNIDPLVNTSHANQLLPTPAAVVLGAAPEAGRRLTSKRPQHHEDGPPPTHPTRPHPTKTDRHQRSRPGRLKRPQRHTRADRHQRSRPDDGSPQSGQRAPHEGGRPPTLLIGVDRHAGAKQPAAKQPALRAADTATADQDDPATASGGSTTTIAQGGERAGPGGCLRFCLDLGSIGDLAVRKPAVISRSILRKPTYSQMMHTVAVVP